jgi:hypothetical protein
MKINNIPLFVVAAKIIIIKSGHTKLSYKISFPITIERRDIAKKIQIN